MTVHRRSPLDRLLEDVTVQFASLKLVEEIDKSILSMDSDRTGTSLEALFIRYMRRFSQIQHLKSPLLCYVNLGPQWGLLQSGSGSARAKDPKTITLSTSLYEQLTEREANSADVLILTADDHESLTKRFHSAATILLYPMFSESNRPICMFVATDSEPKPASRLLDAAFENSLKALVFQLSIAYNYYERTLQHTRLRALWETFSRADLSPAVCFKDLAKNIRYFLPSFGPLKFRGKLEAQILMLRGRESDRELVIRGTTGAEPPGTRIALTRSFTGRLLRDKSAKSLCADPTSDEYRQYFKDYLGRGKPIRTELAVRLADEKEDVGVLNLESPHPDAFNIHHVNAIERLAETIAPVLAAFETRLAVNADVQLSISSSTASFLDAITAVYRHDILNDLNAVSTTIETKSKTVRAVVYDVATIEDQDLQQAGVGVSKTLRSIAVDVNKTSEAFDTLLTLTRRLSAYSSEFLQNISGYSETGPMDLRGTIEAAVRIARGSIPRNSNIEIAIASEASRKKPVISCSPLLKLHLYSLLKNAILSIMERQVTRPDKGQVRVTLAEFRPPLGEVKLNEEWSVSIWDDGVGVKPDHLKLLAEFEYGVRFRKDQGSGSGLAAAQKFIVSVGGRMILKSHYGSSFEVIMYFNKQQPKLARRHGETSNGHSA